MQTATTNAATLAQNAKTYSDKQIQDRVSMLQGQSSLIQSAVQDRIAKYDKTIEVWLVVCNPI